MNEKAQFFIDNWVNQGFDRKFGEVDFIEYPPRDKFLSIPKKQIEYYKETSLNQYLTTSKVDVDIVYSS